MILLTITIALAAVAGYFGYKQSTTASKLDSLTIKHETVLKYVESLEAQKQPAARAEASTKKKMVSKQAEVPVSKRGRKPKSK